MIVNKGDEIGHQKANTFAVYYSFFPKYYEVYDRNDSGHSYNF